MKHVGPFELHTASLTPEAFGRPAKRKSLFKRILVALHQSRRRQARNIIRRYRGLLADDSWSQSVSTARNFNTKEDSKNANADQATVRTDARADQG